MSSKSFWFILLSALACAHCILFRLLEYLSFDQKVFDQQKRPQPKDAQIVTDPINSDKRQICNSMGEAEANLSVTKEDKM